MTKPFGNPETNEPETSAGCLNQEQEICIVRCGDTVVVRFPDGDEVSLRLVQPSRNAPRDGETSIESPLGRAIQGAAVGSVCAVDTPNGTVKVQIVTLVTMPASKDSFDV